MPALHSLVLFYILTCLGQNVHGTEIIHGKEVPEELMPYMVSVQNSKGHVCGGFLISKDFVLTAAHCAKSNPTSVVLGTHNLKNVNDKMRYSVTPCKHPDYKKAESGDDIMLLKLRGKVRLNGRIKPIKLPKAEMDLKVNTRCSVAGWGLMEPGGRVVDDLREVDVSVVSMKECVNMWRINNRMLPNNVTCAGGFKTNKGFCRGDSGGPLVCAGKAVGVASFSHDCNYPSLPNIYTDVTKYLPWINSILKTKHC